jgi:hypothetical protein
MARDHDHNPDPNVTAARIVREATAGDDQLPDEEKGTFYFICLLAVVVNPVGMPKK